MGMKVAVSIPDPIFAGAEALVRQLKTSRSEIYARALDEFIGSHAPDRVTEALDEAIDAVGNEPDTFATAAARRTFSKIEW